MHKIKLTEGLRKLRRTNIPISVISSDLGYSSPSYFSKVFFKYLNTYPQKIRQKNNRWMVFIVSC
ncbi:AraC family transcriptional regulator [Escherichia albertii]|nr:AraC family transcriptional regulator [Escherichia albertii]MCZ9169323.1 AraC family transcriptional regulator [Escherichia albertii]MCZ9244696.1 AraC family transcriptional regulator [Escherichia albertii]MCZ9253617.1 AraC family transcriptional regulator [Escherichia albertii]MCZ9278183.1 AraC family transcriptional regulator [Escherichia albertii]